VSADTSSHEISLAVWDVASPLAVNTSSKIKVGAKCSAGCELTGQDIEIRNEAEITIACGKLGSVPWPGTTALYWTQVDVMSPTHAGTHTWAAVLPPLSLEAPHATVSLPFNLITVPPPQRTVIVEVVEKDTGSPVDDVEVRFSMYRASTDKMGVAKVRLPDGIFELAIWKLGYHGVSKSIEVVRDVRIQLTIKALPEEVNEYWMG